MTAKSAVLAALIPLCFVPGAVLGYRSQVRYRAFEGVASAVARVEAPLAQAALAAAPPAAIAPAQSERSGSAESAPVRDSGPVVRITARRPTSRTRGCAAWHALGVGPGSRAADANAVRMCEDAVPSAAPIGARAQRAAPRIRWRRTGMEFVVDLASPR